MLKQFTIATCLLTQFVSAGESTDTLNLNNRMGPINEQSNLFKSDHSLVWGGSAIKGKDGKYHLFYATWGNKMQGRLTNDKMFYGMRGWVKYSKIAHAVSDKPTGPFIGEKIVLEGTGDYSRWDTFQAHNPHVKKFGDKYYLYYIAQSPIHAGGKWMSNAGGMRISVVVADSITDLVSGKFKRLQKPLISPNNKETFHRVVNPSVELGHDGKYHMMFKSASNRSGGGMKHWIATAPTPVGPFKVTGKVLDGGKFRAEDPYFWYDQKRKRYYAIVKNFAKQGNELGPQFKCLCLITSEFPNKGWAPAKNKLVSLREYKNKEGKLVKLSNLERPQLLFNESGEVIALFCAAATKNPFSTQESFNIQIPILSEKQSVDYPASQNW